MSRPSSADSLLQLPVIPPIITSDKDRSFLINLNGQIDDELIQIESESPEQRFLVYKSAFDRIIDYVSAYKPLLTAIKAEYEECIETIQRGEREAFYLAGKVKAMTSEPSTIHNYRKRGDELEEKISVIRDDNHRLEAQLRAIRRKRELQEKKQQAEKKPPPPEVKKDHRPIPGLSVKQSTDIKTLNREVEKLDKQLKELSISQRTRYQPKETKLQLKEQLESKVAKRDQLTEETEQLKLKRQKLKVAVEAAQGWMKIQPAHQTIGEAVSSALSRANRQGGFEKDEALARGTPSTTFEEDDPTREKEAEMMLEYIERFNELIQDDMHAEAAVHAANSPKGILRTNETLNRFKDLEKTGDVSALLLFCEALMTTVPAFGVPPNEYISLTAVKCSLEENRLDLLSHWLAQHRLSLTEEMGDLIMNAGRARPQLAPICVALSQQVYTRLGVHYKAVSSMIEQGRINQAVEYARQIGSLQPGEYLSILKDFPSHKLSWLLWTHDLTCLGRIIHTLRSVDETDLAVQLLQDIHTTHTTARADGTSLMSRSIRDVIYVDQETREEEWHEWAALLSASHYQEAAIEILASVTVKGTIRNASILSRLESQDSLLGGTRSADESTDMSREVSEGSSLPAGFGSQKKQVGFTKSDDHPAAPVLDNSSTSLSLQRGGETSADDADCEDD